jgi:hypothetical protein
VTGADAEGLVETYRGLKAWRVAAGDGASEAAVFVVGGRGPEEAGRFHRRLRAASQRFLGRDVAAQGYLAHVAAPSGGSPEPLCVLAQAPAERVWSWLTAATAPCAAADPASGLAAAPCPTAGLARPCPSDTLQTTARTGRAAPLPATSDPAPAVAGGPCPVFSIWQPEGRECLVAAIEVQAPALMAGSLREVFRVEVDEAGAPPLAGVRADGALVAILLQDGDRPVDTGAAAAWLNLHRSLFIRAYPRAGIQAGAAPAAIVLAPLSATPRTDGVLRFLPVRFGGHRGIVLVP